MNKIILNITISITITISKNHQTLTNGLLVSNSYRHMSTKPNLIRHPNLNLRRCGRFLATFGLLDHPTPHSAVLFLQPICYFRCYFTDLFLGCPYIQFLQPHHSLAGSCGDGLQGRALSHRQFL